MVRRAVRKTLLGTFAFAALVVSVGWAAGIADDSGHGHRTGLVLAGSAVGFFAGSALQVMVHEFGHLLAAKAMRLRVLGVRMWKLQLGVPRSGTAGSSGHVLVDLSPGQRGLPARMVVVVLAGPLANAAAAATTAEVAATQSFSLVVRVVAVGLTVSGWYVGILNLVPFKVSSTLASDGLAVLRWIYQPDKELARNRRRRDLSRLRPILPPN